MASSFRGASQRVRPLAGLMTGSATEPGIHNHDQGLWIPGPRQRARPGMTSGRASSQPPLPALETLQVLETLALIAGAAEIEFLDVLIVAQLVGAAVEHDLPLFHDVAVACHRQRGAGVLLDQQDGDAEVAVDLADDGKHL